MTALAFEIGTEEIPAFDLQAATKKLADIMGESLDNARIEHGQIRAYTTPRRLMTIVDDVKEMTQELIEESRGPSCKIAFDENGNPTKAAEGFARGKGLSASDLLVKEVDGVEYVFAKTEMPSRSAIELLPDILLGVIRSISWPKSMKWSTQKELFSRPVRWIVAMLGDRVVDLEFAGVRSGDETYGHRVLAPGAHKVADASALLDTVKGLYVVTSEEERKSVIEKGVAQIESQCGCTAVLPAKTLTEVVNLSEYPTPMLGTFDEEFLKVPEEIIVDAMLMHQRYFPLYDEGKLTNKFIIVSNGNPECQDNIVEGNERVVAARLYDAKFFYEEDLKKPLEEYVDLLDDVIFQEQLGTMRTKTNRIVQLADKIALEAGIGAAESGDVSRAALLCKADLVTNAVIEFTSVQGIMGSYYADASGESQAVVEAVADHYKPRFAGDSVPDGIVGKIVAFADKLDTVVGLFAIDQAPTGSSDPFAVRRSALGMISILNAGLGVSLRKAIEDSLDIYLESGLAFDKEKVLDDLLDFFTTRCRVILHEEGIGVDTIDAVLNIGVVEPVVIFERVRALQEARDNQPETFEDLATAYARANNLRDASIGNVVDASLFNESEEKLSRAIESSRTEVNESLDAGLYPQAVKSLASLRGPIDEFFENTMVMDENADLKRNRIALLNRFVEVFSNVADFQAMSKQGK